MGCVWCSVCVSEYMLTVMNGLLMSRATTILRSSGCFG